MPEEIPLTGGSLTPTVRAGDTVRRTPGPWTPAVHALLWHLESAGFEGAPRPLGFDDQGREILSFIDGVAGYVDIQEFRPPTLWADQTLVDAARLLRRYHDATSGFIPPTNAAWQLVHPDPARHEVICHNDYGPYNCIFRDGHPHAAIDFDTAGPGPRAWDVAYAAWRFVPLGPGPTPPPGQGRRLKLFCDVYGLEERHGFVNLILERIDAARRMVLDGAAAGHAGYRALLAEGGHIEGMGEDLAFVEENAAALQAQLDLPSSHWCS